MSQGDFTAAHKQFEFSVKTAQMLGDQVRALEARINLGMIDILQGSLESARTGLEAALQKSQESGLQSDEATCISALGDVSQAEDDLTLAGTATSGRWKSAHNWERKVRLLVRRCRSPLWRWNKIAVRKRNH